MGLFDIFSTGPADRAAADSTAALEAGKAQATEAIQGGLRAGTKDYLHGLSLSSPYYTTGLDKATGAINTGVNAGSDAFMSGVAPFLSLRDYAAPGMGAYADATGANGQAGFDRATTNFRADPGYQFMVDQANENALRGIGRTGDVGGNEFNLAKYITGLADQTYGNYVNRLLPFLGTGQAAAAGIQSGYAPIGAAKVNAGGKIADLTQGAYGALGGNTLGTYGTIGGQTINTGNTLGALDYGTAAAEANAKANADLAAYGASGNEWSALLNGAKLGASVLPFMPKG